MIILPFFIGNCILIALAIACFFTLSAARAYVGGESEWSKSRAQAVEQLRRYIATDDRRHLATFEQHLLVPRGDSAARRALQQDAPDYGAARQGFLQGKVAASDITPMMLMLRVFGHTPLMQPALDAWEEGDALIDELAALAKRLSEAGPQPPGPHAGEAERQLVALERRFLLAEQTFTASLGDASRQALRASLLTTLALGTVLTLAVCVFVYRTVLQRGRDEARLRAINRRWTLASQAEGLGLMEWSVGSDTLALDEQACQLYGLPCDAPPLTVQRAQLRQLIHPADQPTARATVERCLREGGIYKHGYRVLLPDSSIRHLEVTGTFEIHDGAPQTMAAVVRDVSHEVERKRLEAERAAAQAHERMRAQFLSRVSHELRTPLNAILGFSQLLARSWKSAGPPPREYLKHIDSAGRHLLFLVDDLLELTSLQTRGNDTPLHALPLHGLVEDCIAMVDHVRRESNITIVHDKPEQPVLVKANEQRLRQVFVNLLSNGCKYNRRGGELRVSYRLVGDGVRVEVADQGAGLSAAQVTDLFEPFKRFHGASHASGTGLGLVIVKQALDQMGGSIEVSSETDSGCVFAVMLPILRTADEALAD